MQEAAGQVPGSVQVRQGQQGQHALLEQERTDACHECDMMQAYCLLCFSFLL
jgi:hypothetical protein